MKNKMMCHYQKFHFSSKKFKYILYTNVDWEELATKKKVCKVKLTLWIDKALETEKGRL